MNEHEKYDAFIKRLEESYPRAMRNVYCGVSISEGWYHIVESLVRNIQHHIRWKRGMRARDLIKQRNGEEVEVTKRVSHIEIHQVKEKFGGLRFYYQGGDETVSGMVRMAEAWAEQSCEACGERGVSRRGGWVRTLCDKHEAERQEKMKERFNE